MKRKALLLGASAAALLWGGHAAAAEIVIADSGETTLQSILDGITVDGSSSITVGSSVVEPSAYWKVDSGQASSQIVIEIAGHSEFNTFGVYDRFDSSVTYELFAGSDDATDGVGSSKSFVFDGSNTLYVNGSAVASFSSANFGFYLDTPDGIWYSDPLLNSDGAAHMVGFAGPGDNIVLPGGVEQVWDSNNWIFGWEDLSSEAWDQDYNDFVVHVSNISAVPEPMTIGLLGAGLIAIGFAGRGRRRKLA
jgi:hypothetical protein